MECMKNYLICPFILVTLSLCIITCHLSSLHIELNADYFIVGELDANRSVPFRFTPSLQTFISTLGKTGMLTMCMLATARCLAQPYFSIQSILRAILRDEYIAWYKVRLLIETLSEW